MKKFVLLLVATSFVFQTAFATQNTSPIGLSNGQKLKMYDKSGSYQGYYKQSGNTTKEYNKYGSYQGSYKQSGSTIKHYDKNGSYQGYYKK